VLQQVGIPTEIYERPANRFVARFVGSPAMNLLPAAVVQGVLRAGPFAFDLGALPIDRQRIELGVRPEHVEIVRDGDAVPATVEVVETAGSETLVHVRATGTSLVARVSPDLPLEVGATVRVSIAPRNLYIFDAETGAAVSGIRR